LAAQKAKWTQLLMNYLLEILLRNRSRKADEILRRPL